MADKKPLLWFALATGLMLVYGLIFAMQFNKCIRLDISAFYSTAQALSQGLDPYQNFIPDYLPHAKKLPANLNPPIFLILFKPFSQLRYEYAVPAWSLFTFMLGILGAWLTIRLAFPKAFVKTHGPLLLAIYLLLFSTLMDTAIVQLGSVIFSWSWLAIQAIPSVTICWQVAYGDVSRPLSYFRVYCLFLLLHNNGIGSV